MKSSARNLHSLAEHAREDGKFLEALKYTDEATLLYEAEDNLLGLAEVQGSRFLTFRHLWEKTGRSGYLLLAKHAAMAASELAIDSGQADAIAMPFFNLGKAHETMGELSLAIESYKKAVDAQENSPSVHHARPAVLNDMKVHLFVCEYKNGNESALAMAEDALHALIDDESEGSYTKDVWVSGGYMKIAEAIKDKSREKANQYFDKASEIIKSNPDLVLRRGQLERLKHVLND